MQVPLAEEEEGLWLDDDASRTVQFCNNLHLTSRGERKSTSESRRNHVYIYIRIYCVPTVRLTVCTIYTYVYLYVPWVHFTTYTPYVYIYVCIYIRIMCMVVVCTIAIPLFRYIRRMDHTVHFVEIPQERQNHRVSPILW